MPNSKDIRRSAINNFRKGMYRDADLNEQPESTFYDSKNGIIRSVGDGKYAWENKKGNKLLFELCDENSKINGFGKIENSLIVTHINTDTLRSYISEIKINDYGYGTPQVLYTDNDGNTLGFSLEHPIREIIGFKETENIKRVYFTDFYNNPRVINKYYFQSVSILEVGTKYLVTCGEITHDGNPPYTVGDTFTATDTSFTGTGTVVKHLALGQFNFNPTNTPAWFTFLKYVSGSLFYGSYIYFYRLYSNSGASTNWYGASNPIQIVNTGPMSSTSGNEDDYQNEYADESSAITSNGARFKISNINTDFDNIQVAAFRSTDYETFDEGNIFWDGAITSEEEYINHTGQLLSSVTLSEMMSRKISIDKCKAMANLYNRFDIANIKEREELNIGHLDTMADLDYGGADIELPCDYTQRDGGVVNPSDTDPKALYGHKSFNCSSGLGATTLYTKQWYKVEGGNIITEDESGTTTNNYSDGDYFQGETDEVAWSTDSGSPRVTPYIRISKYLNQTTSNTVYKNIPIENGFLDFTNPLVSNHLKGYWGREKYRIGVLFYDLKGIPFYVRWLGDITFPSRRHDLGYELMKGRRSENDANNQVWHREWNIRTLGFFVNNLNIKNIRNKISGFSIVRAPRDKIIQSEGLINYCGTYTVATDVYPAQWFRRVEPGQTTVWNTYTYYTPEHLFKFNVPSEFNSSDKLIINDYFRAEKAKEPDPSDPYTTYGLGSSNSGFWKTYYKFFDVEDKLNHYGGSDAASTGSENTVQDYHIFEQGTGGHAFDSSHSSYRFKNICYGEVNGGSDPKDQGMHSDTTVFVTEETEGSGGTYPQGFGAFDAISQSYATYIRHEKVKNITSLYGGESDEAIANTLFIHTGHYQEITQDVLDDIETHGGNFIFDEIQVFGGDAFVCIMDVARCTADEDGTQEFGSTVMFPVQTEVNVNLREGTHPAKNRHYGTFTTDYLGYDSSGSYHDPEVFNYNDALSTNGNNVTFAALPVDYLDVSEFEYRHRYSLIKSFGEKIDNYRNFPSLNYIDVNSNAGAINNIKSKRNRLYYWQDKSVGYMPIQERAMSKDPLGNEIVMGVGGTYERYDEKHEFYGNQHQFGLVETENSFVWYDSLRATYIDMNVNFGLKEESLIKGMDSYFKSLNKGFISNDNPAIFKGISSGYDKETNTVYHTFAYESIDNVEPTAWRPSTGYIVGNIVIESGTKYVCHTAHTSGTNFSSVYWYEVTYNGTYYVGMEAYFENGYMYYDEIENSLYVYFDGASHEVPSSDYSFLSSYKFDTISYATEIKKFTGKGHDFTSNFYLELNNKFYLSNPNNGNRNKIYLDNANAFGNFFGTVYNSSITFIVNKDYPLRKAFHNYTAIGNDTFFSGMECSNSRQNASIELYDTNDNLLDRFIEYRLGEWIGAFPLTSLNERLRNDGYLKMKLYYNNNRKRLIRLLSFGSIFIKSY